MIKRKICTEPFEAISVNKRAYDMSNIEPDRFRKEIKNYIENLYPFMSAGLQYVNFSKPPDENGDAIGTIEYSGNSMQLTIPVIVEEYNLKEPTVAIYNGRIVPIDKEYLDYVMEYPEYGEQVNENELPANMQYLTQSGLFQNQDSGVYKGASQVIATVFEEDPANPYHYYGSILKRAADNTINLDDMIYCDSATMLKYMKEAEDANALTSPSAITSDKRVVDMPVVQKITDSGRYRNVMVGGDVVAADAICSLFSIEGGPTKTLVYREKRHTPYQAFWRPRDKEGATINSWGYGEAYGSGYEGSSSCAWEFGSEYDSVDDILNKYIVFLRPGYQKGKGNGYDAGGEYIVSTPYKVDMIESINYGDKGTTARILFVESLNDGSKYKFIISDKVGDIRKIDNAKLKNSSLNYLYDELQDIYIVPESYRVKIMPDTRLPLDNYNDGYSKLVAEIANDYPNTLSIIDKGAGMYTINVNNNNDEHKYANVSSDGALLLSNYYTGQNANSMSEYKMDQTYAFKGDIAKHAANRTAMPAIGNYKGEYDKLAKYLNGMDDAVKKVANISETVDKLVGIEASIDDEHIDTSNVLQLVDNIIGKIGELLLMSRLGKNDISESILSRALYAMVKLSNEIRGMANANAL